jgi:hypothetical protein
MSTSTAMQALAYRLPSWYALTSASQVECTCGPDEPRSVCAQTLGNTSLIVAGGLGISSTVQSDYQRFQPCVRVCRRVALRVERPSCDVCDTVWARCDCALCSRSCVRVTASARWRSMPI